MNGFAIRDTQTFYLVNYLSTIYGTSQPCYSYISLMLSLIGQLEQISCWGYQTKVLQDCASHVTSSFLEFNYHSQYTETSRNLFLLYNKM